jgi:hypothetical protein
VTNHHWRLAEKKSHVMEFVGHNKRAETDRVSSFIRALAVGMIVLGAVFGVLDRWHLLPQLPAATAAHAPAASGHEG